MRHPAAPSTRRLTLVGVMAAFCFLSNYLSIPIGDVSRIHFGNVFCVLSGLLLGPVAGGLCGGIGAFFRSGVRKEKFLKKGRRQWKHSKT